MKVGKFVRHWLYEPAFVSRWITRRFHSLYYHRPRQTWRNTTWLGTPVEKCPLDLWIYQELIHRARPDWVIETGTAAGGSAAWLAALCELVGHGRVASIDVEPRTDRPRHPRLTYHTGRSTDPEVVAAVRGALRPGDRVLVLLDSDHTMQNVLAELRAYADLVSLGSWCIVEDTNLNGHPVMRRFGPGPMEAVRAFLAETDAFEVDRSCEKFYLTFHPGGFLRRVK